MAFTRSFLNASFGFGEIAGFMAAALRPLSLHHSRNNSKILKAHPFLPWGFGCQKPVPLGFGLASALRSRVRLARSTSKRVGDNFRAQGLLALYALYAGLEVFSWYQDQQRLSFCSWKHVETLGPWGTSIDSKFWEPYAA